MSVFDELDEEWWRIGRSSEGQRALARWSRRDAPLRPFRDLSEVVRFAWAADGQAEIDEVLACLARRAPDDQLAARCLLQCLTPGLIHLARRYRHEVGSDDEVGNVVLAAAYERIVTYPFERRPRKVAANVVLDTQQKVSRNLFRKRVKEVLVEDPRVYASEPEVPAADELLEVLRDAHRGGRLSAADAELITSTRIAGYGFAELAEAKVVQPATLSKRRQRAEALLAVSSVSRGP